jgi:hypothetical protein
VLVLPPVNQWSSLPDDDGDGTPQALESSVKSLDVNGAVAGDGNGDGIADAAQQSVSSVPFLKTPTAVTSPGVAPPTFVSLVADSLNGKPDTTDAGSATLENVKQLDAPASLPPQVKMPLGLISFDAKVSTVGMTETFSLYVDSTLGINAYWKQVGAGKWVNLASPAYGGQVVTEGGRTRLDFKITDGGTFDSDGKADGVITDPGAPGFDFNTAPTIDGVSSAVLGVLAGVNVPLADFTVADAEQGDSGLNVTLIATNGNILGLTDAYPDTVGIQLVGSAAAINTAIAGATFTASAAGAASIAIGVSDGVINSAVTGIYSIRAAEKDSDRDQFPDALEAANGLTVGIKDNDVFTSSKFFVMQLYRDILYREAEPGGLAFWQNQIDSGTLTRPQVASAFLASPEFIAGTGGVARLYFGALQRLPDAAGMDFWMQQEQSGTSLSQIASAFTASKEFTDIYGGLSDTAFVDKLYLNMQGKAPTPAQESVWVNQLTAGASRSEVLLSFTDSADYKAASKTKLSVALDYIGLLGRPAEQAGFDWWVEQQDTNIPEVQVIGAFVASPEYHGRFLP